MSLHSFRARIRRAIADANLQVALDNNAQRRKVGRLAAFALIPDHQQRRQHAKEIKADIIANLDQHLSRFIATVEANGIVVHRAADSAAALRIFKEIAATVPPANGRQLLVAKSKTMVSEEIEFNHAMEAAGMRVVETDLGEYIVQLRGERPAHIITPAVHLRRNDVGRLFEEKLGLPYTEEIPILTNAARRELREVFLNADIGISGANFGVVESGSLVTVTNEGNGRMCTTLPPVHVALMGIERLVPTLDDLALFLTLLPRSATGQKLCVYTSLLHSPRRSSDRDGARQRHLILVDNGRTAMSSSPLAEALACIRCGACLNACPVFRETSGHAYIGNDGSLAPYPGPIGSVVSPGLFGCENFGHLAQASSLCGACREACPVDIDLPGLLLRVRAGETGKPQEKEGVGLPGVVSLGLQGFRLAAASAWVFALLQKAGAAFSRIYSPRRGYMKMPAWTGWGYSKEFPRLSMRTFKDHWQDIRQEVSAAQPAAVESPPADAPTPAMPLTLQEQFIEELTTLGGKVHSVRESDLPAALAELLREKGITHLLADAEGAAWAEQIEGISTQMEADDSVPAGITGAVCGVADTGSLLILSGSERPLTASLLPEIHIVILRAAQLLPTLAEAFRLPEVSAASAAVVISGPSRTADIEMTLTIGVHGPGELHVYLIDDSAGV